MRPYKINVQTGQAYELAAQGNYVRLKTALVVVKVECLETGESIELEQGDDALLTGFKSLRVSHDDTANQDVVLQIGNNTRASSSKVGGSVIITPGSVGFSDLPNVTTVAGAPTLVAAANPARKELFVGSWVMNSGHVTLGGASVAVGVGLGLAPGQQHVITANGAVYVFDSLGGQRIMVAETVQI